MTQMVNDAFRKQRELNLMLCLQSKVEISHFVWFSLQRLSEESTKLNVSGDASAGYDWRHHLEVDKAAREREEVILKQ